MLSKKVCIICKKEFYAHSWEKTCPVCSLNKHENNKVVGWKEGTQISSSGKTYLLPVWK